MTTLTAPVHEPVPARAVTPQPTAAYRLSFPHLLRSEWIKFTSLRSTWWSFALVAVVSIGLSVLQALALASFTAEELAGGAASVEAVNEQAVLVLGFPTVLTQLLAVIIGTIAVTGEYSTGMIRSTLTAAPRPLGALLAKSLVVGGAMFFFSLLVFGVAALVAGPILPTGMIDLSDPNSSVMPLLGASLYLALMAMMGVGLGFAIRNGPGALAAGISLIFVAPIVVMFFPRIDDFAWVHHLASFLPSNAGQSLFMGSPMSGDTLDPWAASITLLVWAVGALIAGSAVLKARDA